MSEAPLVSVVMTSYNRADYIADAIDSVLKQTCGSFELIVCDDASTDATVEIARDFARQDPRVRVSVNPRNLGDYPNRNHAASLARGRFLKYHDSDDVMYPHCLQVMTAAMRAHPEADLALSASQSWSGAASPMLLTPKLAYEREFLGGGLFHLGPSAALFRTEFFRSVGGFPLHGAASDYVFWFKACRTARVLLVAGDLFYYRIHNGQELNSPTTMADYTRARKQAWEALHSADCPLAGAELDQARVNFVYTVVREAYRSARAGRYRAAVRYLRDVDLRASDWARYLRRPRREATAGTPSATDR